MNENHPDELSIKAMNVALDATYKALDRKLELSYHDDDCPCKECWQERIRQSDILRKEHLYHDL